MSAAGWAEIAADWINELPPEARIVLTGAVVSLAAFPQEEVRERLVAAVKQPGSIEPPLSARIGLLQAECRGWNDPAMDQLAEILDTARAYAAAVEETHAARDR